MTTPFVSMTQVIIDWIASLGWDQTPEIGYQLFPGTYILEDPDRAVFISPTGGPGYMTEEGAADAWSFQARIRGTTDDPFEPEARAIQLDQLILSGGQTAAVIDGVPVQSVHRAAGPPTALPVDPNDLRREFTCSYIIVSGE